MIVDEKLLEIISYEAKDAIKKISVVTPTIYTSIFSKYAARHNAEIGEEEKITDELLNDKIALFCDIQNQTILNTQKLSDNAERAISAIRDKDDKFLSEILNETQKLREEIIKLKESMYKDELTHAYNRKWLHDNVLDEEINGFKDSGTLAVIDLNYFKTINDTYGHTVGDKVLIFIAHQLNKIGENVVRYGGDEFIVIFYEGTTEETALSKLNAVREDLLSKHLKAKDASFKVSFSVGVHEFKKGNSLNEIIEIADRKMYSDKTEIKKRVPDIH